MLLFVYGTMLRHQRNHARLYEQGAIYIGDFETANLFQLYLIPGHIPCAVQTDARPGDAHPIVGELYAIEDDNIGHIDACEGHPTFYERKSVTLAKFNDSASHPELDVQMYVYVGSVADAERVHHRNGLLYYA